MKPYKCVACGVQVERPTMGCPGCQVVGGWIRVQTARATAPFSEVDGVLELVGCGDGVVDRMLGGGFGVTTCVAMIGGPGVGKSTLSARWAVSIAQQLGGVAMMVCWESSREVANQAVARSGCDRRKLLACEDEAWEVDADQLGVKCVVIDSISARGGVGELRRASAWATSAGGVAIALCHVTGDGGARGGPQVEHWASGNLWVSKMAPGFATVKLTKCRWAVDGECSVALVAS